MDESELQRMIVDEMKELRKGEGLKPGMRFPPAVRSGLLAAATDHDGSKLYELIETELDAGDGIVPEYAALRYALNIPPKDPETVGIFRRLADVTKRRAAYAERTGLSTRTVARHEDEAIEAFAVRMTERLVPDERYKEKVTSYYYDRVASLESLPDDLPSLVRSQAGAIGVLTRSVQEINMELDRLQKMNAKMAKLLGMPVEDHQMRHTFAQ